MKGKVLIWILGLSVFSACQPNTRETTVLSLASNKWAEQSTPKTARKLDSTLAIMTASLENGLILPMKVVSDTTFQALIDHPAYRPKVRQLLEKFASENRANMVQKEEKGERISVSGQIIDESNNMPLKNVNIEIVHTTNDGAYSERTDNWNPRIFAYLLTDQNGKFEVTTIRPGRYLDEYGKEVPSHIHFTLNKEGYRSFGSEFSFEDDSVLIATKNIDNLLVAKQLENKNRTEYFITLPLQKK